MARCPDCIHQYCCKYDRFFCVNEVENKCIYFKPTADVVEVKHGEWISVNKQLPETYIEVLVCFKADGSNVIAFLNRFRKWKNASTDNFIESEITHWMPLPKPPKI